MIYFLLILCCIEGLKSSIVTPVWGNMQRAYIHNYEKDNCDTPDCVMMEPFLSRDGKWLFFNSENVGQNTSLHYAKVVNSTYYEYQGRIGGQANNPVPHLDAVPAMDNQNRFYWVSTRDYPQNYLNLLHGQFDSGSIPIAERVEGNIYIPPVIPDNVWIIMDQEINIDGSLLFYVNAHFGYPPGPTPKFSNISYALKNSDGSFSKHPDSERVMKSINDNIDPQLLKYAPSSLGTQALEFYFTTRTNDEHVSSIYIATRNSSNEPFNTPSKITIPDVYPYISYKEPEATTISADGKIMLFTKIDCQYPTASDIKQTADNTPPTPTCQYHLWKMDRLSELDPRVLQ